MKRITKKWLNSGVRPVVIFDYDDTLFDFLPTIIKEYNQRTNSHLQPEDITDWDLSKFGDIHVFMDIIRDADLWKRIPPKKDAIPTLQRLINDGRYTILIASACTTLAEYVVKVEMIENLLPGFDTSKILSVLDKQLIRGDIIFDDKLETCYKCVPYMKCVLVDAPHNQNCNEYERIFDMAEVPKLLEDYFCI